MAREPALAASRFPGAAQRSWAAPPGWRKVGRPAKGAAPATRLLAGPLASASGAPSQRGRFLHRLRLQGARRSGLRTGEGRKKARDAESPARLPAPFKSKRGKRPELRPPPLARSGPRRCQTRAPHLELRRNRARLAAGEGEGRPEGRGGVGNLEATSWAPEIPILGEAGWCSG